jgi:phosphate/sulfate permease
MTLGTSWRATRGNGWRLLAGVLAVSLPPTIAGALLAVGLGQLAEATGSLVLDWLSRLAPVAGAWLQAPLLAAFLSYAYLFLRQRTRALEPQA